MSTSLLVANAVSHAANNAADEVETKTGKGFILENNQQFNMGTPRGGGTVKQADVQKIAALKGISEYFVRQNATADLIGIKNQKLKAQNNVDAQKEAKFGNSVNIWGVNNLSLDNAFRSGALKMTAGRSIKPEDKGKVVIHEDIAKANGLQLGSKIKLKANPYDADNIKQSTTEVTVEVVGLFTDTTHREVARREELSANTFYTDLDTSRALYQYTKETEIYQDANFFVAKNADSEQVLKAASELQIDWRNYQLARNTQYLSGITKVIEKIREVMTGTMIATLIFSAAILALILFLWLNERKKETGVLLSLGVSKLNILAQYLAELIFISIPAFLIAYFSANAISQNIGNSVLSSANSNALEQMPQGREFSTGLESSMATKSLDSLAVSLSPHTVSVVIVLTLAVIIFCVVLAALPMLRKSPRELLVKLK